MGCVKRTLGIFPIGNTAVTRPVSSLLILPTDDDVMHHQIRHHDEASFGMDAQLFKAGASL